MYTERGPQEEQAHPGIVRIDLVNMVLELGKLVIKVSSATHNDLEFVITDTINRIQGTFDCVDGPALEIVIKALQLLHHLAALDDDRNMAALDSVMSVFLLDQQVHCHHCFYASADFESF